jgi:pectate lyase
MNRFSFSILCVFLWVFFCFSASVTDEVAYGWASQGTGTTGGKGGKIDTVDGSASGALSTINTLLKGTTPEIVFLKGTLAGAVKFGSNKTLIGLHGAQVNPGNITVDGVSNVIIRNIILRDAQCTTYGGCKGGTDALHVISQANHLWIDHCDIADGQDGNFDQTHAVDYVTVSNCLFSYSDTSKPHRFSNLVAASDGDSGEYAITWSYNWWWKNVYERMPRFRYSKSHIVNNLYTSSANLYCIGVGYKGMPLIINNAFIGVNQPIDLRAECDPTLAESHGNLFTNCVGNTTTSGKAFVPPYKMDTLANSTTLAASVGTDFTTNGVLGIMIASQVEGFVKANAGATLFTTHPPVGVMDNPILNQSSSKFQVHGEALYVNSLNGGLINLSVYDLSGRCIFSKTNKPVASGISGIGMEITKPGTYIYKVSLNKSESGMGKFIIQ